MNRRLFETFGTLAALAVVTVAGCKKDPLSDLDGNPAAIITNFSYLQLAIGDEAAVTAQVIDARATPLAVPITFTPCTADITVATDPTYNPVPATSARAIVTAVSANPSCVVVAGGGVSDTITVAILPQTFGGTLSSTTLQAGDTLTIGSTAVLKFDTATVSVRFGGGALGTIVSKTRDQLKVLVPVSTAAPLTIGGIDVTYVSGLIVALTTAQTVTQTGNRWANAVSWQTAPDWTSLIPGAAASTNRAIVALPTGNAAVCPEVVMGFGSAGPCAIFRVTLAAPTALRFRADWIGTGTNPDVDLLVCSDSTLANFDGGTGAPCDFEGFGGATTAKPQTTNDRTYAAGTWWFVIENYSGAPSPNHYVEIIRP